MMIIGAGMSGLIAANFFRKWDCRVIEKQPSLPNNHEALLRFKTDAISKAVGIPFEKVYVRKFLIHDRNYIEFPNPYFCNMYSRKVSGKVLDRSTWNIDPGYRYIAPRDFIAQLANGCDIEFSRSLDFARSNDRPIISTIPMPVLMDVIGWKHKPEFHYRPIWSITCDIADPIVDVCQTLYFAETSTPVYRASLVKNHLIIEMVREPKYPDEWSVILGNVLDLFGIGDADIDNMKVKQQQYGKITPIDEDLRKEFIYTMSREYNIYSLGRYATWRQILLDDLVNDLEVIKSLISVESRRNLYNHALAARA